MLSEVRILPGAHLTLLVWKGPGMVSGALGLLAGGEFTVTRA